MGKDRQNQYERTCEVCSKTFSTNKYKIEHGCARYCGKKCANVGLERPGDVKCLYCGNVFMTHKKRAEKARFCSFRCYQSYSGPSSIEIFVSDALDKLGFAHESQFQPDSCRYIFDELVYPNVLIEVNGDYWHSLPGKQEHDETKRRWAIQHGYHILTITESEINKTGAYEICKSELARLDLRTFAVEMTRISQQKRSVATTTLVETGV